MINRYISLKPFQESKEISKIIHEDELNIYSDYLLQNISESKLKNKIFLATKRKNKIFQTKIKYKNIDFKGNLYVIIDQLNSFDFKSIKIIKSFRNFLLVVSKKYIFVYTIYNTEYFTEIIYKNEYLIKDIKIINCKEDSILIEISNFNKNVNKIEKKHKIEIKDLKFDQTTKTIDYEIIPQNKYNVKKHTDIISGCYNVKPYNYYKNNNFIFSLGFIVIRYEEKIKIICIESNNIFDIKNLFEFDIRNYKPMFHFFCSVEIGLLLIEIFKTQIVHYENITSNCNKKTIKIINSVEITIIDFKEYLKNALNFKIYDFKNKILENEVIAYKRAIDLFNYQNKTGKNNIKYILSNLIVEINKKYIYINISLNSSNKPIIINCENIENIKIIENIKLKVCYLCLISKKSAKSDKIEFIQIKEKNTNFKKISSKNLNLKKMYDVKKFYFKKIDAFEIDEYKILDFWSVDDEIFIECRVFNKKLEKTKRIKKNETILFKKIRIYFKNNEIKADIKKLK